LLRIAQCSCGQLSVTVEGEPQLVVMCNCEQCQRRTGSVFGVGAYYARDDVKEITGKQTAYRRSSDSGRSAEAHFCPVCGTSVYWQLELFPDRYGIAVGCFAEPTFPQPTLAVWSATKHAWVRTPEECHVLSGQGA